VSRQTEKWTSVRPFVAGGVQALQSHMEGRTYSADEEGAEARRAVAAKVVELGGWDAVQRDPEVGPSK